MSNPEIDRAPASSSDEVAARCQHDSGVTGIAQSRSPLTRNTMTRNTMTRNIGLYVVSASLCCLLAVALGFWLGSSSESSGGNLTPLLAASASSTDSMAIASGPIGRDTDGIFFLDFITGDLQCLVWYPRNRAFGARYYANVRPQLGGDGKNPRYIMVTGAAVSTYSTGGAQPGGSLVYVVDATSGMFAAYAVPWDRTAEQAGRIQNGPLVYVGGGPIRNFQLRDPAQNQPAAIVDPNQKPK